MADLYAGVQCRDVRAIGGWVGMVDGDHDSGCGVLVSMVFTHMAAESFV